MKTDKELETRLTELHKEQFNLRFQKATGQLANTAQVSHVRKEIAKIQTVLGERREMACDSPPRRKLNRPRNRPLKE